MARYLIVEGAEIVSEIEATSVRGAVAGLRNGVFTVYTLQGQDRTVKIEQVTEAKVTVSDGSSEPVEEE
jgi:hypothetical protein